MQHAKPGIGFKLGQALEKRGGNRARSSVVVAKSDVAPAGCRDLVNPLTAAKKNFEWE
jgi:hypothetical protein